MNANELRILNYVDEGMVQSLPMHQGEMYAVLIKSEIHSFGAPTLMDDIKPIPLTEKWLLDFGFKKETESDWFDKNVGNLKILSYNSKMKSFVIGHGSYWTDNFRVIRHVHQLQNLYFALTNKELILTKTL